MARSYLFALSVQPAKYKQINFGFINALAPYIYVADRRLHTPTVARPLLLIFHHGSSG